MTSAGTSDSSGTKRRRRRRLSKRCRVVGEVQVDPRNSEGAHGAILAAERAAFHFHVAGRGAVHELIDAMAAQRRHAEIGGLYVASMSAAAALGIGAIQLGPSRGNLYSSGGVAGVVDAGRSMELGMVGWGAWAGT